MSRIIQKIVKQNVELIRDRIFEILVDELDHQAYLENDTELKCGVFLERSTPLDKTELAAVTVAIAQGKYSNKHQGSVDGDFFYQIDTHVNSATIGDKPGDLLASLRMQKIMFCVRAILEDPIYKTLGYEPPFILGSTITEFDIAAVNKMDALHSAMGRLVFYVRGNETSKLLIPKLIESYKTTVKMDATGRGYLYYGVNYG